MKPSVGRIVHFAPANPESNPTEQDQPNAAIVTYVHNDTCVNLYVINKWGTGSGYTSVVQGTSPGTWSWPPRV